MNASSGSGMAYTERRSLKRCTGPEDDPGKCHVSGYRGVS